MTDIRDFYFLPLLLAAKRARVFAVSALFAPCGVLGAPNDGPGVGDPNGLPIIPLEPAAKLNPPVGVGVGVAGVPTGSEMMRKNKQSEKNM